MDTVNFEKFVTDLIKPLVLYPADVVVKELSDESNVITLQVMVNKDDLGRVIGKNGRVINALRTITYACAARNGKKIEISVDSF